MKRASGQCIPSNSKQNCSKSSHCHSIGVNRPYMYVVPEPVLVSITYSP